MTDLAEFLAERLAEDERHWRVGVEEGSRGDAPWAVDRDGRELEAKRKILALHEPRYVEYVDGDGDSRSSVDCMECEGSGSPDYWPCPTLRALAAVYSDHSDYDERWLS